MQTDGTNIFIACLAQIEGLEALRDSLQREFEYFASTVEPSEKGDTPAEKALRAKKNQIAQVEGLIRAENEVFEMVSGLDDYTFNLRACLLYYGADPNEVDTFTSRSRKEIQYFIREYIQKGIFSVPENVVSLFEKLGFSIRLEEALKKAEDWDKPKPEPEKAKFASEPIIPFSVLESLKKKKAA